MFRIYDVQRPDKKSTSRVAKYFVMDSEGDPIVKDADAFNAADVFDEVLDDSPGSGIDGVGNAF